MTTSPRRWQDRLRNIVLHGVQSRGLTPNQNKQVLQRALVQTRLRWRIDPFPRRRIRSAKRRAAARTKPRTGGVALRSRFDCFEQMVRAGRASLRAGVALLLAVGPSGVAARVQVTTHRWLESHFEPELTEKGGYVCTERPGSPGAWVDAYKSGWRSKRSTEAARKLQDHRSACAVGACACRLADTSSAPEEEEEGQQEEGGAASGGDDGDGLFERQEDGEGESEESDDVDHESAQGECGHDGSQGPIYERGEDREEDT